MLFYFAKNTIKGGGGVVFHNSGHRLALGHVIDMVSGKSTCFFVCLI